MALDKGMVDEGRAVQRLALQVDFNVSAAQAVLILLSGFHVGTSSCSQYRPPRERSVSYHSIRPAALVYRRKIVSFKLKKF
ncbi:hypothetical protein SDC9_130118 [bioreactor metagenome]|uniref:Uncharacterized protein n=1 Tax=bioreactor metagenome TaxID=1076179 RepID=A0A645D1L6_9ZZZZ